MLSSFVTGSIEERAQRWASQKLKRGNPVTEQEALESITTRDKRDKGRAVAPLIIPDDAIVVDNSVLSQQQTLEKILDYIAQNRELEQKLK